MSDIETFYYNAAANGVDFKGHWASIIRCFIVEPLRFEALVGTDGQVKWKALMELGLLGAPRKIRHRHGWHFRPFTTTEVEAICSLFAGGETVLGLHAPIDFFHGQDRAVFGNPLAGTGLILPRNN